MERMADILFLANTLVLVSFVAVTVVLFTIAVANRLRMRRVLLTWRSLRNESFPLAPAAFLILVCSFLVLLVSTELELQSWQLAGYVTGGALWLISSLLARGTIVTEHGFVLPESQGRLVVSWSQVVDYCEHAPPRGALWTFVYLDAKGSRAAVRVTVPKRLESRFRRIISERLDPRFDLPVERAYGRAALKR
jgi:hypothetical protein